MFYNNLVIRFAYNHLGKQKNKAMEKVIRYTNARLASWYRDAKLDYGVEGSGETRIEGNEIFIDFTENGVSSTWSMAFYPEYVLDNGIEYFFNVWMEEARAI